MARIPGQRIAPDRVGRDRGHRCGRSLLTRAARGDRRCSGPGVHPVRRPLRRSGDLRPENTSSARKSFFGSDPSWVDNARLGDVTLLRNVGGQRGPAFQQLFWNRSVKRVVLMPGATIIDPFPADAVAIARDGSLRAGDAPLDGPLLVDQHVVTVRMSGAKEVATAPGYSLFEPTGTPRLSMLFAGRHHDGWLGGRGAISLWPASGSDRFEGRFFIDLVAPRGSERRSDPLPASGRPERRGACSVPRRASASAAGLLARALDCGLLCAGHGLRGDQAGEPARASVQVPAVAGCLCGQARAGAGSRPSR